MRSLKIGSVLGIGLYIHWTFLIIPISIAVVALSHKPFDPYVLGFMEIVYLSIFTCVMLHELGHALMARRFGVPTKDITLYPIGGVARLERIPERPWEEFWIAIAGPLVNVVIAAVFFAALDAIPMMIGYQEINEALAFDPGIITSATGPALMIWLLFANVSLVAFNMLPAFPMDGGRVLRALLASCMSHLRATEWAAAIGGLVAVSMIFHPLTFAIVTGDHLFNPMLSLVGFFVFFVGQNELRVVRYKAVYGHYPSATPPEDAEGRQYVDASAVPSEPNFSGFTFDRRARAWIEWRNGRPIHASYTE